MITLFRIWCIIAVYPYFIYQCRYTCFTGFFLIFSSESKWCDSLSRYLPLPNITILEHISILLCEIFIVIVGTLQYCTVSMYEYLCPFKAISGLSRNGFKIWKECTKTATIPIISDDEILSRSVRMGPPTLFNFVSLTKFCFFKRDEFPLL